MIDESSPGFDSMISSSEWEGKSIPLLPVGTKRWVTGIRLDSKPKQYFLFCLIFLITVIWVGFTLIYAFLSSASTPRILFSNPGTTILVLSILSSGSVFLLGELVTGTCEFLRWTMSVSKSGVGTATFIGLSRATSGIGVLSLIFSNQQGVGHRKWLGQRITHVLIRVLLGILLLSNVSFETIYVQVDATQNLLGGVTPFNFSLVTPEFGSSFPFYFTLYANNLLGNPQLAVPIAPTSQGCQLSGHNCHSYIMPGDFDKMALEHNGQYLYQGQIPMDIPESKRKGGMSFVVQNVPGYQLEYFPIRYPDTVDFQESDCGVFGLHIVNIKICLKNIEGDLIAAWTACPESLVNAGKCFDKPYLWGQDLNQTVQLHMASRLTTTAYSLKNSTIESVIHAGPPTPVLYPAQELLQVLRYVFEADDAQDTVSSTATEFLFHVSNSIQYFSMRGRNSTQEYNLFTNILAMPLYQVTGIQDNQTAPANLHVTGYVARDVYRVIISRYSLYLFTTLSILTLLWCAVFLGYCWFQGGTTPNTSLYPEIDFCTKVNAARGDGLSRLLKGFGNGKSGDIEKRIAGTCFLVRDVAEDVEDGVGRVAVITNDEGRNLQPGRRYG